MYHGNSTAELCFHWLKISRMFFRIVVRWYNGRKLVGLGSIGDSMQAFGQLFFSSMNEWRDKKSRLTASGMNWYRIPIFKRTYQYILLFLFSTVRKNFSLTAYTLQIDMQTCHIMLPYICKFHQLNICIAKNVYVTFFFNLAEFDFIA